MEQKYDNPIRVLEVFGKMNRGGAETMMMNLYRKMDKSCIQLDFMVHTDDCCQFDDEIVKTGGRIYRVPRFKVYNFFSYRRAWRLFYKEHPEHQIIHGHMGATAAIYLHEANKVGRFTIAHSHSAESPKKCLHDYLYAIFSMPTRYVAKFFMGCSTEAGIARFGKRIVSSNQYTNFPNAINLKDFTYDLNVRNMGREKLGISNNSLVFVHVGRVTIQKNPFMLYQIFKEIVRQDSDAICLWVGTGELEDLFRQKIETEHLQDRIWMTGVRDDIPTLLMLADCFLFPSLWEGLPVSVIEAQASGLPCVISDTISKEVEITSYIEWKNLSERPADWAFKCLTLAKNNRGKRNSPIEDVRKGGYDIEDSVKWMTNFYFSHQKGNDYV